MRGRLKTCSLMIGVLTMAVSLAGPPPDSDGDGVPDSVDVCCATEPGVEVDSLGRPLGDLDGDCDVDLEDIAVAHRNLRGPIPRSCCADLDCNDDDACTKDICQPDGKCAFGSVDCDDHDDCTDDSCDPLAGCKHVPFCPVCSAGGVRPCYSGPGGTLGVGACHAGQQTCSNDGTAWGPCQGEIIPTAEICANGIDEDCNGAPDDGPDLDGDGWTRCNGDCCDSLADGCGDHPELVNPGALELIGNGIDDDCDPNTSDVTAAAACSNVAKFTGVTAADAAAGMDLCQTTTANPPLQSKKWGLVSATYTSVNGVALTATDLTNIQNFQAALLTAYGTGGVVPRKNSTLAGISTGKMRDANDPDYVLPITGTAFNRTYSFATMAGPLGAYLFAHGGMLVPGNCGAFGCPTGNTANDGVVLRLTIRVPTNVHSFTFDSRFFSAEYHSYQCTSYNDYYLALLTSSAPGIPVDKNIVFDALGKPVNVNSGFLQVCGGNGANCGTCPYGTAQLAGTGMDAVSGAGTPWLRTSAPVVPGETITLDILIFDVSDMIYDCLILLDNFAWSTSAASVSTQIAP